MEEVLFSSLPILTAGAHEREWASGLRTAATAQHGPLSRGVRNTGAIPLPPSGPPSVKVIGVVQVDVVLKG